MGPSRQETQSFFAERASRWDSRFPDDAPRFAAIVDALRLRQADAVLDLGCGTGRASEPLRAAVGPDGRVIAIDVTPEMLDVLVAGGRRSLAAPLLADGSALPLAAGSLDAVLAVGFLPHVADVDAVLAEIARVVRPAGRLALAHLTGHAPDEGPLRAALAQAGWRLLSLDSGAELYVAVAERS